MTLNTARSTAHSSERDKAYLWAEKLKLLSTFIFRRHARRASLDHLNDHALADIGIERANHQGATDHYYRRLAGGR